MTQQPSWSDEARPWAPPREGVAVEVRDISRRTRSLPLARTAMASRCLPTDRSCLRRIILNVD